MIAPAETDTPERVLLQDSNGLLKEDHARGGEHDAREPLAEVESARPSSETTKVTAE